MDLEPAPDRAGLAPQRLEEGLTLTVQPRRAPSRQLLGQHFSQAARYSPRARFEHEASNQQLDLKGEGSPARAQAPERTGKHPLCRRGPESDRPY